MALTLRPYTNNIRKELDKALCIQTFPCQNTERHNKPEVERRDNPELVLPAVTVSRSDREGCLIEPSINSVRISLRIGRMDMLEEELVKMYLSFLMQRAEMLGVLRRAPVEGYDVSFLITDQSLQAYGRQLLLDFVVRHPMPTCTPKAMLFSTTSYHYHQLAILAISDQSGFSLAAAWASPLGPAKSLP